MTGPGGRRAGREAAEWHARLQSRFVSNDELERFYEWRRDSGNADAFDRLGSIWLRAAKLGHDPDIAEATRVAGLGRRRRWAEWMSARRWSLGGAVTVAIAVLAVFLIWRDGGGARSYSTGRGETLFVRLDDGSQVTLNTATEISVSYRSRGRDLELLKGQALFKVAHDPGRPFQVVAGGATVTALGTEFEVRRAGAGAGVSVTLVQGRISIASDVGARSAQLHASGETLEIVGKDFTKRRSDPAVALSWVDGKIDLRDVPLGRAVAEVNRYAARPVILEDEAHSGTRISGVFETGDREGFVAAVTGLLPLRATDHSDGTVRLRAADDR